MKRAEITRSRWISRWSVWSAALAAWLAAHSADAQDADYEARLVASWRAVLGDSRTAPDGTDSDEQTYPANPSDPDVVREGAFPAWRTAIAAGARVAVIIDADLDADGDREILALVRPVDPYPYDRSDRLVMLWRGASGFRATVLRSNDAYAQWRLTRGPSALLIEQVWSHTTGHASEGFWTNEVRVRARLMRNGEVRPVGGCVFGWSSDGHRPTWGTVDGYNGPRCR